ncbi:hypothetical protein KW798_03620 [Candidatus Parcubacteria bacterium]|nr:hypothetical protein [Candidatus Parcubacteria bacterium]
MQNNALWVGIGVVVVAAIGILGFMGMKNGGTPASVVQNAGQGSSTPSMTIRSLLASGSPQKCTFASSRNDTSSGTMYFAGGKARADFSAQNGSSTFNGHFIVNNDTTYVWADGIPQGFKSSFSGSAGNPQAQVDPDAPGEYSCEPWTPDQTFFGLPKNINFITINSAVPTNPSDTGGTGS